jgi:hypothetical protein
MMRKKGQTKWNFGNTGRLLLALNGVAKILTFQGRNYFHRCYVRPLPRDNLLSFKRRKRFREVKKVSGEIDKQIGKFLANREKKIFQKSKKNFFTYIKRITKTKSDYPPIKSNQQTAYKDAEKAQTFKNHFSSYQSKSGSKTDGFFDYSLIFLTENEVYHLLKKLPNRFTIENLIF